MEGFGSLLDLNKREIITMALRDFLDKAKSLVDEYDAWPLPDDGGMTMAMLTLNGTVQNVYEQPEQRQGDGRDSPGVSPGADPLREHDAER